MKEYHIGVVTRNIEKASGRTTSVKTSKVSSEALQGAVYFRAETLYDGEYPEPAYPPFGFVSLGGAGDFWVAKVGDNILIEIDETLDLPDPRYICSLYTNVREIHRDFKKNYPWRMGKVTNSGHKLIYDDKVGEETINFEHTFGQRVFFDKDGSLLLEGRKITSRDERDELNDEFEDHWFKFFFDRTNNLISLMYQYIDGEFAELKFDKAAKKITLHDHHLNSIDMDSTGVIVKDKFSNTVTMDTAGIKIADKNGNIIEMKAGKIIITASGDIEATASGKVKITSTTTEINGNATPVTSVLSHQGVIDLITGVPINPTTKVFMDK